MCFSAAACLNADRDNVQHQDEMSSEIVQLESRESEGCSVPVQVVQKLETINNSYGDKQEYLISDFVYENPKIFSDAIFWFIEKKTGEKIRVFGKYDPEDIRIEINKNACRLKFFPHSEKSIILMLNE